jgi:GT2 family glycosyltransferase
MQPDLQGPNADASVAVVIVNYRTPRLTMECLHSLRHEKILLPKLLAYVVDGGSGDGSAAELAEATGRSEYKNWVSFLPLATNGGFGWANNQAILTFANQSNPPEFVHLLNPDTLVESHAVEALVGELCAHPRCAAAGSQLVDVTRRPGASAFRFPSIGREFTTAAQSESLGRLFGIKSTIITSNEATEVDWVTGASAMFRLEALRDSGLFDDGFFLYFDEVELMHRLRKRGWTVRHVPASLVMHLEGASTGIGESVKIRRLPDYWYHSRRRYFALTGGRSTVILANLAIVFGRFFAVFKTLIRPSGWQSGVRVSDLFRVGFWPRQQDGRSTAPRLGGPPGVPPSWMAGQ